MSTAADDKVDKLTIAVTENTAVVREQLRETREDVAEIKVAVYGNGKAGLKLDVARLKWMAAGGGAAGVGTVGLVALKALGIIFQ